MNSRDRFIGNAVYVAIALTPSPFKELILIVIGFLLNAEATRKLAKRPIIMAILQLFTTIVGGYFLSSLIDAFTIKFIANGIWWLLAGFLILKDIIMVEMNLYNLLWIFRWFPPFVLSGIASWPFLCEEDKRTATLKTLAILVIALFLRLGLYWKIEKDTE